MSEDVSRYLRNIPSMDKILSLEWVQDYYPMIGRKAVKSLIESVLEDFRASMLSGETKEVDIERLMSDVKKTLEKSSKKSMRPVINATGVIVHTNLGRSCLADEAIASVHDASRCYTNLEYNLEAGKRGHRYDHVEWLLCQLTGAEAALVVNNNAGAVLMCLTALASDGEIIISRGELIEIGESFRIPDIMALSGAKMVEVGTTNRTHLYDYERAITEETRLILKVHPSNYRIVGFHSEVGREDLDKSCPFKRIVGNGRSWKWHFGGFINL
ncbi:L-seryl-tRNA(Sec) selenium transferase [Acetomicrobium sp.]|uniref:L-seryl-tRNA(Sec) selenium transferase n=1 Tax=Acetomicrobium sp. TaxID=1872099 RepID=UPI002870CC42|nr:L-seryl-tRNA(Sec) selenium transferase [Acetomicrobium sp.]MDR9770561.1 L-seryl-tRNA(Sec) selenium transferase [Acetomicrobium sp.]